MRSSQATAVLTMSTWDSWLARVGIVLLAGAATATLFVDSQTAAAIMAIAVMAGLLASGIVFTHRSRNLDAEERKAWRLVGTGMIVTAAGIAIMIAAWAITSSATAFGPFDLVYLSGYGIGLAGFASLPHTYGSGLLRMRMLLDGLIGAIAVATLLWVMFLQEIARALREAPTMDRIVGSSYVFLDIAVIVVLMIVLVRRSNLRFDLRLMLFGLAALSQTVADIAFLLSGAGRAFTEATPLHPLNITAIGFFLATSLIVDRMPKEREYADRSRTPAWAMIPPYGFAVLLVAMLVIRFPETGASATDQGLLHATVLVGCLVIARQAVAIRENRRLVDDQRAALVSSISHELRTPLTAMVGFLDLLDAGTVVDETERAELTTIVSDQASYLSRIVSDLVMLAGDHATSMELTVSPTPVDELAWSSVSVASIEPTSVRVDAERGVTAFLDRGRMQQAMANLLTNAERYGAEAIVVVAKSSGGDLLFEVHDDGPGVPRKYELIVWDKFERGPHRLNATVPGSGIGLAVTNAIAQAHGGAAGYRRSERLGGACFWIRLPGRVHMDHVATKRAAELAPVDHDLDLRTA